MSASLLLLEGDNEVHLQGLVDAGFEGLVELCYLDPPYNTGKEFTTYSDKNSTWLADLEIRLRLISRLLAPTGVLLLSIDDNEVHYLKVLCDQVDGWTGDWTGVVLKGADRVRSLLKIHTDNLRELGSFRYYEVPIEFVTKCTLDEARAWLAECEEVWQ